MDRKDYLDDIVVVRLILIVLLVVYHTFAPFSTWAPISDTENLLYEFICQASYSFMLPAFVFISGLVAGHQIHLKGKPTKKYLVKKFKRLIIPSIIFSLIYYVIFENVSGVNVIKFTYDLFNGIGHMWFLPMLFWCFVILFIVVTLIDNDRYIKFFVAISIIGSICAFIPLPLRLVNAVYYFNFFYIGFLFGCKKIAKFRYINNWGGYFIGYIFFFMVYWNLRDFFESQLSQNANNYLVKGCWLMLENILKLPYMWFGTLGIYSFVNFLINKNYIHVSPLMRTVGSYCFGVYIFQQFILKFLYYNSDLIYYFNVDVIPWIALVITFVLSLGFTYLVMKTRIGRMLIG